MSAPSPSFALADRTNVNVDQPASNNELEEALLHLFNSSEHLSVYTSCQLHHYNEAMRKSLSRILQQPEMARLNYIHQNWDGNNETLRSEAKTIITNHFSPTVVSCCVYQYPLTHRAIHADCYVHKPLSTHHLYADCYFHRALSFHLTVPADRMYATT